MSRRANPQRLGAYGAIPYTNGVFVSGRHAYVSADDSGLMVLDVSDRASPKFVGQYSGEPFRKGTTNSAVRAFVSGSLAYVAANTYGLVVIDVSDPANPWLAGAVGLPGFSNNIIVRDGYAYVQDYSGSNGLWVIDVSRPDRPLVVSRYPLDSLGGFSISGEHAFVGHSRALEVLTLDNPANPQRVGYLEGRGNFSALFATDGLLCAAGLFSGFEVIDVTRPQSPRRLGQYRPEVGYLGDGHLFVAGEHAYAMNTVTGLHVLDVSNPEAPRRVGGNPVLDVVQVRQMFVAEGAVFIAAGNEGLLILDEFRDETGPPSFRRGDANDDGLLNLSDAVFTLSWLFRGDAEPGCVAAGNVNGDEGVDLTDPIYVLAHLFQGGPPPLAPFPDCGPASLEADDVLGCGSQQKACQ